ncbi:MAG: GxxExxY protein [Gemmatimonadaceae bacterium]
MIIVEKELSYTIVGAALEVHKELGYGFHESVYVRSLAVLLTHWGTRVLREVPVTVLFRGVDVGTHRLDLLVENRVVVEVKSMERVPQIFRKQVRNYLAATDKELGLLINFGPSVETHRILRPLRLSSKHLSSRSGNSSNSGHSDVPSPPVDI